MDLEGNRSRVWSYGSCTFVGDVAILAYCKERFDKPWQTLRITRVVAVWLEARLCWQHSFSMQWGTTFSLADHPGRSIGLLWHTNR